MSSDNTIVVWSLLVRTPDGAGAYVTLHPDERECLLALRDNYDPEREFGDVPEEPENYESWAERFATFFNLDVTIDNHEVGGHIIIKTGIYVDFSAGRRGVNAAECRWCARLIHRGSEHSVAELAPGAWYDGEGLAANTLDSAPLGAEHQHEPALEMGPTLGPFGDDFVQVTYDSLRDLNGDLIAVLGADGDWMICEPHAGAGERYSDYSIYTSAYKAENT